MIFYCTFGQAHVHSVNGKTLDKDCCVEIEADNEADARRKMFGMFGAKWACMYPGEPPEMQYIPRGIFKI
jgi:hypothetical protein